MVRQYSSALRKQGKISSTMLKRILCEFLNGDNSFHLTLSDLFDDVYLRPETIKKQAFTGVSNINCNSKG